MSKIKFGTDGWRAIIAKDFTVDNVAKLSEALVIWAKRKEVDPKICIGYDCRFGGRLFAETAAKVFAHHRIEVILSNSFVPTPAVSMVTRDKECVAGVVITASHNPPDYNGYKLKGSFGGPMQEEDLYEIEKLIPEHLSFNLDSKEIEDSLIQIQDLEKEYLGKLKDRFNVRNILDAGIQVAVDAMYGSGQNIWPQLFPNVHMLHAEINPSFNGVSPEPVLKNLNEFQDYLRMHNGYDLGVANDGDADRIALFDDKGNYIDSHHVILLLIYYLAGIKGVKGKVVTGFSSVTKIQKLCNHYGLDLDIVKIGFKHASKIMIKESVILAGEESGGIALNDHVPERDGIWSALTILELMQVTGKSISELINEVYRITGPFHFLRKDLKLPQSKKEEIVKMCQDGSFSSFEEYQVERIDTLDGFKFIISENEWTMIRPSGTEPVLRIYVESKDQSSAQQLMEATLSEIGCLSLV